MLIVFFNKSEPGNAHKRIYLKKLPQGRCVDVSTIKRRMADVLWSDLLRIVYKHIQPQPKLNMLLNLITSKHVTLLSALGDEKL